MTIVVILAMQKPKSAICHLNEGNALLSVSDLYVYAARRVL